MRLERARAELLLARERFDEAERGAQRLLQAAEAHRAVRHAVIARQLLARTGLARHRSAAAYEEAQAGLGLLSGRSMPLVGWRLLATLGLERLSSGHTDEARSAFQQAAQLIEQISGGIDDEAMRTLWLRSPGVERVRAAPRELVKDAG